MFQFAPPSPALALPLQQSPQFSAALTDLGTETAHHNLPGGTAEIVLRHIPGLGRCGVVSRGPVWSPAPEAMHVAGLAGMRRALGLHHLIINPEHQSDAVLLRKAGFLRLARPAYVAMLSLEGAPQAWLDRMDGKWRNRLRHGLAQELVIERHDFLPSTSNWLFARDTAQQARRGYRSLPHPIVAEIARKRPGAAQLFLAAQGRIVVAAMLFLCHGAMATYQIGWTTREGRSASAHNRLLWEAMQALSRRGHRCIDLGILDRERTPGIDRFKLGAGAHPQALGGTWLDSAVTAPFHALRRWRAAEPR